jgi:putative inorganic carbon (HCO3(-)) transporter
MLLILLILIFIRPFICSFAFPFANSIHSVLLMTMLAAWLIIKGLPKTIRTIQYPLLLFLLSLLISIVFSVNKLISVGELYKYTTGIMLFLAVSSLSEKDKNKTMLCILTSGVLISLLAINQYFFGFQRLIDYLAKQKSYSGEFISDFILRRRAFATFVTPNILGGYLAMLIPLAFLYKKKIWIISLLFVSLLLSKSLGAILSIFFALILYFYLCQTLNKRRLLLFLGLLVLFFLILTFRISGEKSHLKPLFSTVMRLNYWRQTLGIIKASPLTGAGLGNFDLTYSLYAHNSYLQIWAEMGILGLASFLWLIFVILRQSLKNIKRSLYKKQTAVLITASAVFLLHNSLDFSFFLPEVVFIWWVILGLANTPES